jgi:hypothetical protein
MNKLMISKPINTIIDIPIRNKWDAKPVITSLISFIKKKIEEDTDRMFVLLKQIDFILFFIILYVSVILIKTPKSSSICSISFSGINALETYPSIKSAFEDACSLKNQAKS